MERGEDDERDVEHPDDVGRTKRIGTKHKCVKAAHLEAKYRGSKVEFSAKWAEKRQKKQVLSVKVQRKEKPLARVNWGL